jgi:thiol-disulfide isomerase/thioredoxin
VPGRSGLWAALVISLVLTACTGAVDPARPDPSDPGSPPASPTATEASPGLSQSPATSAAPTSSSSARAGVLVDAPWATATLIDVTTGEPFRIADPVASGKVVFLETMAIWCSNCLAQQREATVAFEGLDPERVEWVAVDVESSETAESLARYRTQNGFPFTYAIADAEFARALVADFGEIVLSPPSVNIIVIGTDGRITQLHGHKSAEELRRLAAEHGAA